MRGRSILIIAGVSLAAGCSDPQPLAPRPQTAGVSAGVVSETSTSLWQSVVIGETGPGSSYALHLPRNWNGTAIFYAHGIRDVLEPVSLGDQHSLVALRDRLGALGYAAAYSSFSENGFAVKDGAQRTHQLRGLFVAQFGAPQRSLLVGHSLGGLIVLDLAHRFATQYDGVAPLCGMVGGTQFQFDHAVHTRLLFDLFYPGLLQGTFNQIPNGYVLTPAVQAQIVAAITASPIGLSVIGSTAQAGLEFNPLSPQGQQQLVTSLITALSFHARGADNVLALTNGKFPFSNVGVTYSIGPILLQPAQTLAAILATVNATVPRTDGDPSALNYAQQYATPDGALQIPTLTLHNRWDPLVPFAHEGVFAARVAAAGAGSLFLQRTRNEFGHCNFTLDEQVQAITDLASWVATGVRPAS